MQKLVLRFFISLIVVFVYTDDCHSQNKKTDSLYTILKNTSDDTSRINILNAMALEYENIDPDSSFYFMNQALTKALKINYEIGIIDGYIMLGKYANVSLNNCEASLRYYDKAQKILEKIIASHNRKGREKMKERQAISLRGTGLTYYKSGNYSLALEFDNKSLKIGEELNNKSLIAKSLHNIADVYFMLGNFSKALEWEFKSLKIKEQLNDKNSLASSKNGLGNIYGSLKNYEKALEYYFSVIDLIRTDEKGDKRFLSLTYINIGIIYTLKNEHEKGLDYFLKSLEIIEKYKIKSAYSGCYNNIGNCYIDLGNFNKGLEYFFKGLKMSSGKGETSISFRNIASAYFKKDNYTKALSYALNAVKLAKEIKGLNLTKVSEELLSSIYEKLGDNKKALQHYKEFKIANDSLFNEESTKKMTRVEMNDEFENRQITERAKQSKIMALSQEELNKEKIIRNSLGWMFVLLLIIAVVVIFNYRNKSRANKLLALKTEELYQQKTMDLLKQQRLKTMQNLISGQEMERHRIAGELHDGIGGALAGIKLKLQKINTKVHEENQELGNVILNVDNLYREVRTISHDLAPPQLKKSVFTEVISQLAQDLRTATSLKISLEYLEEEKLNHIPEDVQVAIYRMIQELLKNSLQHAQCSHVEISLSKYDNELNLSVEDNGIGFNTQKKASGMGLRNIQARVKALEGKYVIDSKSGRGSAFNITIPC
jgi:signal transduction histidine kinase